MTLLKMSTAALLSLALLGGCASSTILKSSPTGAKIYVDGNFIGESPAPYSDKKSSLSTTVVEIQKPGYRNKTVTISRDGGLNVGALVGGILLAPTFFGLLFFLWITEYRAIYNFELEPEPLPKNLKH